MRTKLTLLSVFVCLLFGGQQVFAQQKRFVKNTPPKIPALSVAVGNDAKLPIRRVVLYSNGVAYIERRGIVSGRAEINLSFKQSQVDDVLKSMVVLDLGEGKIGAVSYNSSAPTGATMSEIPFHIEAKSEETDETSGGLAGVLMQMQGAKVIVASNKGAAAGSILTVEKRKITTKKKDEAETSTPAGYSLVIASETGEISNFELAEIRSVKLLEEGARRDLNEFASATASARRRDSKTITVTSEGGGQREMVVSYTIAAPIWKTTYRVVLDEAGKPFFQGWAIVDNISEEDWQNVKLSLVSGSPVSFIQNLQKPLYRYRPIIPIPEDLNLQPQIYDPENGGVGYGEGSGIGYGTGGGRGNGMGDGDDEPPIKSNEIGVETSISDALINEQSGIKTAATGSEFGDLFEYRIEQPVTVARNRSALIPIVQTKMDGERVSIYNEQARADRPMSGMLLTNLTPLTFEGGALTVLDRDAYAGEALMERLKPKEKRLISFALDLGTLVTAEQKEDREPARLIKAVNGVFQIHYFKTDKKIYRLVNQTDRVKVLYIEHPIREKWILSKDSPKPDVVTEKFYRFRIELQPFEKKDLAVAEQQGLMDSYQLTTLTARDLEMFLTRRYIDEPTRAKLEKLIELRSQINQISARLKSFDEEVKMIADDQARLRENIEALAKTSEAKQLIARYIQKASEQESRLETINKERQNSQAEKNRLENELAKEIRGFELERNTQ
jgi:hypothetical protein